MTKAKSGSTSSPEKAPYWNKTKNRKTPGRQASHVNCERKRKRLKDRIIALEITVRDLVLEAGINTVQIGRIIIDIEDAYLRLDEQRMGNAHNPSPNPSHVSKAQ